MEDLNEIDIYLTVELKLPIMDKDNNPQGHLFLCSTPYVPGLTLEHIAATYPYDNNDNVEEFLLSYLQNKGIEVFTIDKRTAATDKGFYVLYHEEEIKQFRLD